MSYIPIKGNYLSVKSNFVSFGGSSMMYKSIEGGRLVKSSAKASAIPNLDGLRKSLERLQVSKKYLRT